MKVSEKTFNLILKKDSLDLTAASATTKNTGSYLLRRFRSQWRDQYSLSLSVRVRGNLQRSEGLASHLLLARSPLSERHLPS